MKKYILLLVFSIFICGLHAQSVAAFNSYAKITTSFHPYKKVEKRTLSVIYLYKGGKCWEVISEGKHYTYLTKYINESKYGYYYQGVDNLGRKCSVTFLNASWLAGRLLYQFDISYGGSKNMTQRTTYLIEGEEVPSSMRF